MDKVRTVRSEDVAGSYEKSIEVEFLGHGVNGFVRIEARCPGHTVGNAEFNISVRAAKLLRDALISLFPHREAGVATKAGTLAPHGIQEYKGNGKHDWEVVDGTASENSGVRRLRVPGGWLYRVGFASMTTFVPMPDVVGYKI